MKKILYTLLLPPLLAMQCEKENKSPNGGTGNSTDTCDTTQMDSLQCELSKLPPITTTGEGTFACLLNGKAWLSKAGNKQNQFQFRADYFEGDLYVAGSRYNNTDLKDRIVIDILDFSSRTGVKYLFSNDSLQQGTVQKNVGDCSLSFIGSKYFGEIEILKFDSINEQISITFNFTHIADALDWNNEYCFTDTNVVTYGRADIKY